MTPIRMHIPTATFPDRIISPSAVSPPWAMGDGGAVSPPWVMEGLTAVRALLYARRRCNVLVLNVHGLNSELKAHLLVASTDKRVHRGTAIGKSRPDHNDLEVRCRFGPTRPTTGGASIAFLLQMTSAVMGRLG